MSSDFRKILAEKYENTINNLVSESPFYVQNFFSHMHNGHREISTQAAYIRDIVFFLNYLISVIPDEKDTPLKDLSIQTLNRLNVQDINEYRTYLFQNKKLSNASVRKKLNALSTFFKFLCSEGLVRDNPMLNFEFPPLNSHRIIKLDSELSKQLLEGILRNDKYLATSAYGEFVVDIPDEVKIKRERLVLRNYAICMLFLGAGLRVSELVGLDLQDINFRQNSVNVIVKGGDESQVFFSNDVAEALRTYINGIPLPHNLFEKFFGQDEIREWCQQHISDPDLNESIIRCFPGRDKTFVNELTSLTNHYRRHGRDGFKPARNNNALFLSNRGQRLSVRMIELMIKEMVKTYLPDYDDKDLFSPHKLRATCATRILTQTGDIELASTQLNHKGVAVTAAFYAELQKEKRKDKIKNLDLNDW